jgi:DNA-binding transcriptional ArsR family regulator
MTEYTIPNFEMTITDPETLKVIADSLRLQILKQLKQPKTVKEVGDSLEIPPTKLYYHFSQLEKHKLIRVVSTKLVSGIVEKHYQVTARRYKVDDQLLSPPEDAAEHIEGLLGAIFDDTKNEIRKSVELGLMPLGIDTPCEKGTIVRAVMYPTGQQLTDFCNRLRPILEECEGWSESEPDESQQAFGLVLAFYPIARPDKEDIRD